jgi:hypothetical protein
MFGIEIRPEIEILVFGEKKLKLGLILLNYRLTIDFDLG